MPFPIAARLGGQPPHWVGDGFPVRSLFSYRSHAEHISPFLMLDYAGPHTFGPTPERRGVSEHPHRGFATVTLVLDGELEHLDSTGQGGIITPGDVQYMSAARGILHQEFHSQAFSERGGCFHVLQLWVNLPAKIKMKPPRYQAIAAADIPAVDLPGGGRARVIAGSLLDTVGPAQTDSPVGIFDITLSAGSDVSVPLRAGHTCLVVATDGHVQVAKKEIVTQAQGVALARECDRVQLGSEGPGRVVVMTGEPLDEPVVGYGPFVMNTTEEIQQAMQDIASGTFA